MFSGTWPPHINIEYQSADTPACPTSFPPFFQPLQYPTAHRAYNNLPVNVGVPGHGDPTTAYGGINYPIYRIYPDPCDDGYQTYVGYYPPTGYQTLIDHQGSTEYRGISGEKQDTISHGLAPMTFMPVLQLSTNHQVAANFSGQNLFRYGSQLQPPRDIDWDDPDAVVAKMNKLKGTWRACVGIKKRGRGSRRGRRSEQYQSDSMQRPADQEGAREICAEDTLDDHTEALVDSLLGEEQQDSSSQDNIPRPSAILSRFKDLVVNEQLDKEIELLEQFDKIKIELRPSTPLRAKSPMKNILDSKLTRGAKVEHQSPTRGPEFKAVRPAASKLLALKEPRTMTGKTSTSPTKGLASLRPPKVIAKSSKPTTRPVPFNLGGEVVARKLRFTPEKRRQTGQA